MMKQQQLVSLAPSNEGQKWEAETRMRIFSSPHLLIKATGSSLLGTKSPEWITSRGSLSVATISKSLTSCKRGAQSVSSHVAEFMSGLKLSDLTSLPSTWQAAAAALPAAGRCTSSFQYRRGRGQTGWWCRALAASAQAWTFCCHRSSLRWSPEHGCLSSAPSARWIALNTRVRRSTATVSLFMHGDLCVCQKHNLLMHVRCMLRRAKPLTPLGIA